MVPLKVWPLVLCAAVLLSANSSEKATKDPITLAFQSLAGEEEKTEFLTYFLAMGLREWASSQRRPPKFLLFNTSETLTKTLNISSESIEKFDNMNIPKESSRKLLEWTKTEFNLSTKSVLELVKRKRSGHIRLPDVGELCCPW